MVRRRVLACQRAAVKIQAVWRGILTRRLLRCMREEKEKWDWAATIIQAVYRGHSLRKKLRTIMESAHHISDDDTSFEEDINLDSVNEELLKDVHPLSPVLQAAAPMDHSLHHHLHSSQSPHSNHPTSPPVAGPGQSPSTVVWVPVFALPGSTETQVPLEQWQNEQQQQFMQGSGGPGASAPKPTRNHTTLSSVPPAADRAELDELHHQPSRGAWSGVETTAEVGEVSPSSVSASNLPQEQVHVPTNTKAKNDIATEWKFKSTATAQLMMKRSERQKKLEYKAARRKKLADPIERLTEFHKHDRSAPIGIKTHAPKRQDLVQGKLPSSPTSKQSPSKDPVTYQWVHDHRLQHRQSVGSSGRMSELAVRDPKVPNRRRQQIGFEQSIATKAPTQCSLPQLDSRVLAGHAPTLVSNVGSPSRKSGSSSRSAVLKSKSLHATAADIYENYHQYTSSTPAMKYVFRGEHKH